jgi:hypothetical protein
MIRDTSVKKACNSALITCVQLRGVRMIYHKEYRPSIDGERYCSYCDVFGRMPSLLGNRKLNTSMDTLTTRYCRVVRLPSNLGRIFPLGQPDVVRGRQYTTVSQSVYASARGSRRQLVTGIRRVSARQWVLEESLRSEKSGIRRVAVISRVRSFSVYLVVSCFSSQ